MYSKQTLCILLIFVFFKYNFAYFCLPCTCETIKNSAISASCSDKTSQINENKKINHIPSSLQTFKYKEQISELDFKGQHFDELTADLSDFPNAEKIVFSHNLIKNIHRNSLKNLTLLKTLYLDNNQITVIPLKLFENNHKIEHIFLHSNKITLLAKHAFGNLPNLAEVHLNQNNIEHIEDECFLNVSSLKTLDLSNNKLKTLSLNFIDHWDTLIFVYFDKNPWLCNITLCNLINTSLEKKWLHGRIPECFDANEIKTNRTWENLQIVKKMEIQKFQSPVNANQTVLLICQIHACTLPSMFWSFNGIFLENSSHCIEGYKHTVTNVLNEVGLDDEGLYTCFIDNCTFCGNSSRYLTVIDDVDLNVESTTKEENREKKSTTSGFFQIDANNSNIDPPDVKIPDFCWTCIICLLIGVLIGIPIGIGIIIIFNRLTSICCCFSWFINLFRNTTNKLDSEGNEEEQPPIEMKPLIKFFSRNKKLRK